MKLGIRIFVFYLAIFVVCFYYPINWVQGTLRTRYLEGVEDPLVDQANILAAIVGREMEAGTFDREALFEQFQEAYGRNVSARIYDLVKEDVDVRVYITDLSGTVLFDSASRETLGEDYSHWRDVRLTLDGLYGARTTLADPQDPTSSVLFVAAPVQVAGERVGVLTVAKPTTNINNFLEGAIPEILEVGALAVAAAVVLSFLVSVWITRPIKRLTIYADDVRRGRRADVPRLDGTEIGEMGLAFEKMKEALEGKKYVEEYVQNLTHEIKSPLSAIRGAAELMEEDMPREHRARFLRNIRNETARIREIVDRMLELAALENRRSLEKKSAVVIGPLVENVLESKAPLLSQKRLGIRRKIADGVTVAGDAFLLRQALANLVQNAIDFSPPGGVVTVGASQEDGRVAVAIEDAGSGIPDYALGRVFEKFFSLRRPGDGKKSTGLGLNFVEGVAALHGGEVRLENLPGGGARAVLSLPG